MIQIFFNTFKVVNLFPIKTSQNYFREEFDADHCYFHYSVENLLLLFTSPFRAPFMSCFYSEENLQNVRSWGDLSSNERTRCQHCTFRKALSFLTKGYLTARFHPTRRFVKQQMPRKSEQNLKNQKRLEMLQYILVNSKMELTASKAWVIFLGKIPKIPSVLVSLQKGMLFGVV